MKQIGRVLRALMEALRCVQEPQRFRELADQLDDPKLSEFLDERGTRFGRNPPWCQQ